MQTKAGDGNVKGLSAKRLTSPCESHTITTYQQVAMMRMTKSSDDDADDTDEAAVALDRDCNRRMDAGAAPSLRDASRNPRQPLILHFRIYCTVREMDDRMGGLD